MNTRQKDPLYHVLLSLFCSLIFTICFLLFQQKKTDDCWLDITVTTEKPSRVHLFYDTGDGFQQSLGYRPLPGKGEQSTLRFQLPPTYPKRLRLDFDARAKKILIEKSRLFSLYTKKERHIDIHAFRQQRDIEQPSYLPDNKASFSTNGATPQLVLELPDDIFLWHFDLTAFVVLYFLLYPFVFFVIYTLARIFGRKKKRWNSPEYALLSISLLVWLGLCFCTVKKMDKTIEPAPIKGNGSVPYEKNIQWETVHLQRSDGLSISGRYYASTSPQKNHSAVLLLHGNYPPGQQFPLYPVLATELAGCGIPVLTIDLAGYGKSADPLAKGRDVDLSMEDETKTALQWLEKRLNTAKEKRRITIIGHSMGADPALRVGLQQAEVSSIVLIGPPRRVQERFYDPGDVAFFWSWAQFVRKSQYGEKTFPSWFTLTKWKQEILRRDMLHLLPALSTKQHKPLLFIDGEKEDPRDILFLRKYVRDCSYPVSYLTLEKGNHNCNVHKQKGEIYYNSYVVNQLITELSQWIERDKKQRVSETLYNLLSPLYQPVITLEWK